MLDKLKLAPRPLLGLLALLFLGMLILTVQAPSTIMSVAIKFAIFLYLAYGAVSGRRSAAYILAAFCAGSAVFTAMQLTEEPLSASIEDILLVGWAFVLLALAIYLVASPSMRRLFATSKRPHAVAPPGP
jgi:hypothetical protein